MCRRRIVEICPSLGSTGRGDSRESHCCAAAATVCHCYWACPFWIVLLASGAIWSPTLVVCSKCQQRWQENEGFDGVETDNLGRPLSPDTGEAVASYRQGTSLAWSSTCPRLPWVIPRSHLPPAPAGTTRGRLRLARVKSLTALTTPITLDGWARCYSHHLYSRLASEIHFSHTQCPPHPPCAVPNSTKIPIALVISAVVA